MSEEDNSSSQVLTYVSHLFVSSHFPVVVDKTGGHLSNFSKSRRCVLLLLLLFRGQHGCFSCETEGRHLRANDHVNVQFLLARQSSALLRPRRSIPLQLHFVSFFFFFNKKEVAPLGSVLILDWEKKNKKTMAAVLIRENRHFYSFFNVIIKFCFQISIRATMSGSSPAPNENSMWLSVPGSFRPRANGSRSLTTTAK